MNYYLTEFLRHRYQQHYGIDLVVKKTKKGQVEEKPVEEKKRSKHLLAKLAVRQKNRVIDSKVEEQMSSGRVLACIASRPGQSGRADGYLLEGRELEFYIKKIEKKK